MHEEMMKKALLEAEKAKNLGASGLVVLKFKNDNSVDSNIAKFLPEDFFNKLKKEIINFKFNTIN